MSISLTTNPSNLRRISPTHPIWPHSHLITTNNNQKASHSHFYSPSSHLQFCLSAITEENILCIKLGKYFPYQTVTGESSDVSEFDPIEIFNKRCHLIWGKCWKWQPGKRIQSSEKWEQVRAGAIKRLRAILNFQNSLNRTNLKQFVKARYRTV